MAGDIGDDGWIYVSKMAGLMCHGLRLKALKDIGEARSPISPRTIADQNSFTLSDVSYHVRRLAEVRAIKLASTEPVRGSTKHLYEIAPYGEEVLEWARTMEWYGRERKRQLIEVKNGRLR